jgi:hypothetical protein
VTLIRFLQCCTCSANGRPSGTSAATNRPLERLKTRKMREERIVKRRNTRTPADVYGVILGDSTSGGTAAVVASRRDAIGRDVGLGLEHRNTGAELGETRQCVWRFDDTSNKRNRGCTGCC